MRDKNNLIAFRLTDKDVAKLGTLKTQTGLDRSEILRRLIRTVTLESGRGNKNNSAQSVETAHAVVESK